MHCKDVSMRDVGIPLDEDSIASLMEDWTAYVRTDEGTRSSRCPMKPSMWRPPTWTS